MIKIQLKRSAIGTSPKQRKVLEALGLRKIRAIKTHNDTPAIRGMIALVNHLVEVVK